MSKFEFRVGVHDGLIVVTEPTSHFYAVYAKPADQRQLILDAPKANLVRNHYLTGVKSEYRKKQEAKERAAKSLKEAIGHTCRKSPTRCEAQPACDPNVGEAAKARSHLGPDPRLGPRRLFHACAHVEAGGQ